MINLELAKRIAPLLLVPALGACATGGNTEHKSTNDETENVNGLVITGNTRHDPRVIETNDGESNKCFSGDYSIGSTVVTITQGDNNGPWYGFKIENLPPEVAGNCSDDTDKTVWVTTNYAEPKSLVSTLDYKVN